MLSTGTNTEKSTLLFGGTFDPVHKGHLYILDNAIELSGYERIIIMPAFISNFKPGTHPADAMQRYEMLSLALEDFDSRGTELVLSDWEIRKGGVSYTYDTVCQIYKDYALKGRLGFLMGDDLIDRLTGWYRYDDLCSIVDFVCFTRDDRPLDCPHGACVKFYHVTAYEASSTAVREGDVTQLPDAVRRYIEEHGLYYAGKDCQGC